MTEVPCPFHGSGFAGRMGLVADVMHHRGIDDRSEKSGEDR